MKKGLLYFVIKNRTITIFMVILLIILGLYNYHFLPRQEMPDVSVPVARITTIYPGASPDEVEKLVTKKIEDELTSIKGYDYSRSVSRNGASTVLLFLSNDADIENAWNDYGFEDSNYKIKHNGRNSILLTCYFKQNENIVLVGDDVEKIVEELKSDLPSGVIIDYVMYQPKDVEISTNSFIINLLEGMLFVIIVVFIGMGLRNAAVISAAIPISILITFSAMNLMGIEIHQISIAALIISLGMLVDNAIVVSDAIQVRLDNGEDKMDSCIKGTKDTAIPMLTSTLTTIAVFSPLLLLKGTAGEFLSSIPKICIVALIASYGVALIVTPTIAYVLFRKSNKFIKESKIRKFFSWMLNITMKKKYLTLALVLAIFIGALGMTKVLGLEFFPTADKDILVFVHLFYNYIY